MTIMLTIGAASIFRKTRVPNTRVTKLKVTLTDDRSYARDGPGGNTIDEAEGTAHVAGRSAG